MKKIGRFLTIRFIFLGVGIMFLGGLTTLSLQRMPPKNVLAVPNSLVISGSNSTITTNSIVLGGTAVTANAAELNVLDGVSTGSPLATQLGLKAALAGPTFTGTVVLPATTSIGTVTNTEIGYVDGVTSAIQTQLGLKAPLASPTFTGTATIPIATVGNLKVTGTQGVTVQNIDPGYVWAAAYLSSSAVIRHNSDVVPWNGCGSFLESLTAGYEGQIVNIFNDGGPTYCANGANWMSIINESNYDSAINNFHFPDNTGHNYASGQTIPFMYINSRWRPMNWNLTVPGNSIVGGLMQVTGNISGAKITASGELVSYSANGLRIVQGNYGTFMRNDGNDTFFLLTASGDQYGNWNALRPLSYNNTTGYVTFGNGHNDLAELFDVSGKVVKGSLVSIDTTKSKSAVASNNHDKSIIGIVSTVPGAVMDADGGFHIGYKSKDVYTDEKTPIALVGTVPALVTSENGGIAIGDSIATSSYAGYGAKAVEAGTIVGKAQEAFNPSPSSCPAVTSADAINWIKDDGKNSKKPCFRLSDDTYVGKIMIYINPSWYDPDLTLTSTGDMKIVSQGASYQVKQENTVITRISSFAELVVAKLQVGLLTVQKLVVDGVDVAKKLSELSARVESQQKQIDNLTTRIQKLESAKK